MSESRGVLFLAERKGTELAKTSAELVTAGLRLAGELGEQLFAVIAGTDPQDGARDLSNLGVSTVLAITDSLFDEYSPEPYLALMTEICREVRPKVVLMGHTDLGRDLAPRLAFKLGVGLAPNCVGMDFAGESGTLQVTRPVFGGKAHGLFTMGDAELHVLTVGQRVFEPAVPSPDSRGEIRAIAPTVDPATFRTAIVERVESSTEGIRLEDASIIVSGGRGIGGAEAFAQLKELAAVLGGCVGASRAAVDSGWVPSNLQVGLTGTIVSPAVYLAIGISGAAQHMAGCSSAKTIIAINKDPEAPIFQRAPFGAVADWREVVPPLIEKCRSMLS